jgi:hypothetical protein
LYTYLKEKISILRENEALTKDSERLCAEKDSLMKSRELANNQEVFGSCSCGHKREGENGNTLKNHLYY